MKWEQMPDTRQVAGHGFCYKWILRAKPQRTIFASAAVYVSKDTDVPVQAWVADKKYKHHFVPVAPTLAETFALLEAAVALEE